MQAKLFVGLRISHDIHFALLKSDSSTFERICYQNKDYFGTYLDTCSAPLEAKSLATKIHSHISELLPEFRHGQHPIFLIPQLLIG